METRAETAHQRRKFSGMISAGRKTLPELCEISMKGTPN
jgi:hypothetical protein